MGPLISGPRHSPTCFSTWARGRTAGRRPAVAGGWWPTSCPAGVPRSTSKASASIDRCPLFGITQLLFVRDLSENRYPLFGITHLLLMRDLFRKPVPTFRDHALSHASQQPTASAVTPSAPCQYRVIKSI